MIIGIGIDIVNIGRIESIMKRYGNKFTERIFVPIEILNAAKHKRRAEYFAKRFAAKEACVKALGCGFGKYAATKEITTTNNSKGMPMIELQGNALKTMQEKVPSSYTSKLHISLSYDSGNAIAMVLFEVTKSNIQ